VPRRRWRSPTRRDILPLSESERRYFQTGEWPSKNDPAGGRLFFSAEERWREHGAAIVRGWRAAGRTRPRRENECYCRHGGETCPVPWALENLGDPEEGRRLP
jgi:hypothetical protein